MIFNKNSFPGAPSGTGILYLPTFTIQFKPFIVGKYTYPSHGAVGI